MKITKTTHPDVWKWNPELLESPILSLDVPDSDFVKHRLAADKNFTHLNGLERDCIACHIALTHPGTHDLPTAEHHQRADSKAIAAKLMAGQDKKHRVSFWLNVAIVVLLALIALILLVPKGHAAPPPVEYNVVREQAINTLVLHPRFFAQGVVNPSQFSFDASSNLKVNCAVGCGGGSGGTSSSFGAVFPATGTAAGFIDNSGNMASANLDASGNLKTNCAVGCAGGSTTTADTFANPTTAGLSFSFNAGFNGTTWDRLRSSIANGLQVDVTRVQGNVAITAASLPLPSNAAQESGGNLAAIKADTDKIPSQGQALATGSTPVVLPVAQITTLTPPPAITNFANETGGNLAALAGGVSSSIYQENIKQINAVTPLMGNGVTGTGSQRVTIASDNTAFAVNNTQQGTASQNVAQFGGANVSTGTGAGGAGIPRVTLSSDSSLAANQSVNLSQVNAVTVLTGAGATGTGAQRETVSQDTTTIAGSAPGTAGSASANVVSVQGIASMTPLAVSATPLANTKTNPLFAAPTDGTNVITAAISALGAAPTGTEVETVQSYAIPFTSGGLSTAVSQALTTTINVKASAGQLYGYAYSNPNASVAYVEYYNTATTPGTIGATTNLVYEMMIPAGAAANIALPIGIPCGSGIAVAVATTATGAVAPGTGLTITTFYK